MNKFSFTDCLQLNSYKTNLNLWHNFSISDTISDIEIEN